MLCVSLCMRVCVYCNNVHQNPAACHGSCCLQLSLHAMHWHCTAACCSACSLALALSMYRVAAVSRCILDLFSEAFAEQIPSLWSFVDCELNLCIVAFQRLQVRRFKVLVKETESRVTTTPSREARGARVWLHLAREQWTGSIEQHCTV